MAPLQTHSISSLAAADKAVGVSAGAMAGNRSFGVYVIAIQYPKVQNGARVFQLRIFAEEIGSGAQIFFPIVEVGIELHQTMN